MIPPSRLQCSTSLSLGTRVASHASRALDRQISASPPPSSSLALTTTRAHPASRKQHANRPSVSTTARALRTISTSITDTSRRRVLRRYDDAMDTHSFVRRFLSFLAISIASPSSATSTWSGDDVVVVVGAPSPSSAAAVVDRRRPATASAHLESMARYPSGAGPTIGVHSPRSSKSSSSRTVLPGHVRGWTRTRPTAERARSSGVEV